MGAACFFSGANYEDESDRDIIEEYVRKFADYFDYDTKEILSKELTKLLPRSHRPHEELYV